MLRPPRSTRTDTLCPYTSLFLSTTLLPFLPGTTITLRTLPSPMNFATCGSASAAASIASRGQSGATSMVPRSLPLTWTASVTRRSEEHTSELQSLMRISYAVCCLKKTIEHTQLLTHSHYCMPYHQHIKLITHS